MFLFRMVANLMFNYYEVCVLRLFRFLTVHTQTHGKMLSAAHKQTNTHNNLDSQFIGSINEQFFFLFLHIVQYIVDVVQCFDVDFIRW